MPDDREMYKGYELMPAPKELASGEWNTDFYIVTETGSERVEQSYFSENTCDTREESVQYCITAGKRTIDEKEGS